jgi:hypothetical protein
MGLHTVGAVTVARGGRSNGEMENIKREIGVKRRESRGRRNKKLKRGTTKLRVRIEIEEVKN